MTPKEAREYQATGKMVRRRPVVALTLSTAARDRLDEMASRCGESRSEMVERLVREAEMPKKPA